MNKKYLLVTPLFAAAIVGVLWSRRYQLQNPKLLLNDVKQKFNGVESSYITYTPERYKRFGVETEIYRGGLSTSFDDLKKDFEFIIDAYTGELIDCKEVTPN